MEQLLTSLRSFLLSEDGPTAVEYAVLLAAILLVIIGSVATLGSASGGMWSNNQQKLEAAGFN